MAESLPSPLVGPPAPATGDARRGRRATDVARPRLVRSPVYVLRAIVGAVLVLLGALLVLVFDRAALGLRTDIASLQASWPSWLTGAIEVALALFLMIAIVGTNVFLLVRRMFRRWMMVNVAALAAIVGGSVISQGLLAVAPSDALRTAVNTSVEGGGLGNDGLASVVAVLTVGSVWIGPRLRPWVVGFVAAAASFSFLGGALAVAALPLDVGSGILIGSLVALVLRTRDRTPTPEALVATLAADGIDVRRVEQASVDARGSVPWFVTTTDGEELFVKTLGSDERAADLLFRAYRVLRFRRVGDRPPFSSLRRAVEHEAFLSLAARSRGIRTPQLITVTDIGTDGMLLAYRRIIGDSLDATAPDRFTDEMLRETWRLVAMLRSAAIAHRDLRLANVFMADDGVPWLIDFGFGELAAEPMLVARDVAELLASTAAVVGSERAVAAAVDVVGPSALADALPWIQPLALSTATRADLGRAETCERLREVAADAAGVGDVEYEQLERVRPGTMLMFATVALALYVLIPQVAAASGFLDEVAGANLGWAAAAVALSVGTYVGAGLGMAGAVPVRLRLLPLATAQVAGSFTNRITPAKVGGMATNVRFLQKQGISLSMAASAVGLNTLAGTIVHVALLVVFATVASRDVALPLPDARTTALVVLGLVLLSGLVMLVPVGRRLLTTYLVPALRAGTASIAQIARTPRKLAALFAGSVVVTACYTGAMLASLAAFGVDLPIGTAALVYLAGAAISSAAPTPGGIGATEAALVAGYTAVGVDPSTAFAAVLLFRLATFWLPILPGWAALVSLQRTGRL
jgi:uncharacterized membrane protein YbhN (UPF0104 family)